MSWIREIEAAQDIDDLRTSHSITGRHDANFETLDAKIATPFNENPFGELELQDESLLEEHRAQKDDRFIRGRQTAHRIYEHYRVTDTNESILDFMSVKWDEVLFSVGDTPKDDMLESMY